MPYLLQEKKQKKNRLSKKKRLFSVKNENNNKVNRERTIDELVGLDGQRIEPKKKINQTPIFK